MRNAGIRGVLTFCGFGAWLGGGLAAIFGGLVLLSPQPDPEGWTWLLAGLTAFVGSYGLCYASDKLA